MTLKREAWQQSAQYTLEGNVCTVVPMEGSGFSFLLYDHFKVGTSSGWLNGYWREVLMLPGKYNRKPICPLPFPRFEVLEQAERRLTLRILP